MRIVVDVMGGDHGCDVVVEGVQMALANYPGITRLHLVGDESHIRPALRRAGLADARIAVLHAPEVLTMEDKPLDALRRKKDCSMTKAIELVKQGEGEAVISRGNTGGLMAAATVKLRPLEHVERPAIAAVLPTSRKEFLLLDAGANPDCKPLHLAQFAVMGSVYSREILGNASPRVGILSNGTEEGKGTEVTREAASLCRQLDLNFLGYVEGHDLFEDHVDVVVTDGFVGNIVLKSTESMGRAVKSMLERQFKLNPLRMMGALLAYGGFRFIRNRMNPDNYGGAPLLGLSSTVIKAHGSARPLAIMNAVRVALETLQHDTNHHISAELARAKERLAAFSGTIHPAAA